MTDHLTTERLREIAGSPGNGVLLTYTNLERSVCAELLAKREECEALQERVDLDVDEFQRILADLGDLRVRIVPTPEGCRILYDLVQGIVLRAVNAGRQRVPLIVQRDKAESERDAYKATLDDVCKALGADVDSAVPQALMFKEKAGEAEKLRAELAAVKRQRDELLASSEPVTDALRDIAGDGHRAYLDAYESAVASILAASQPAQQPKPPVGWFRFFGVTFHPVDGTPEERERAVKMLVDGLGIKLYPATQQPKPEGGVS